ncbi:MAG: hypothetical protein ACK2TZ_08395 [Anaerolineales bacterium]
MKSLKRIRFWHLMVGTGFALLGIGLVMIFLPPGVGDSEPFEIEFFEASIESSEMGLALIVLGLSCFLIGRKDLADLRTYQGIQQDLEKTSTMTARLVADQVGRTFQDLPVQAAHLGTIPDLDLEGTLGALKNLHRDIADGQDLSSTIRQAEKGLALLEALDRGDSI